MSDDKKLEKMEEQELGLDMSETDFVAPTMNTFNDNMDRFMAVATVDAVYGEPIEQGENLVIPAAEVGSAMGFGLGGGVGVGDNQQSGSGVGGGGGGWNFSRPVAVIIASPAGVRVEPILDVTKVALAALTTAGFMAGMIARMLRPRR